jgi:hypothetical protein
MLAADTSWTDAKRRNRIRESTGKMNMERNCFALPAAMVLASMTGTSVCNESASPHMMTQYEHSSEQ